MAQADFLATGGVLGIAGLRVGARRVFGKTGRGARKVSDAEADQFVASLQAHQPPAASASPPDAVAAPAGPGETDRVPVLAGPAPRHAPAPDD
jgi:hypothetical protein